MIWVLQWRIDARPKPRSCHRMQGCAVSEMSIASSWRQAVAPAAASVIFSPGLSTGASEGLQTHVSSTLGLVQSKVAASEVGLLTACDLHSWERWSVAACNATAVEPRALNLFSVGVPQAPHLGPAGNRAPRVHDGDLLLVGCHCIRRQKRNALLPARAVRSIPIGFQGEAFPKA